MIINLIGCLKACILLCTTCRILQVYNPSWTGRSFTILFLFLTSVTLSTTSSDHVGSFIGFGLIFYWPLYINTSEFVALLVLQITLKDTFCRTSYCGYDTFILLAVRLICTHVSLVISSGILLTAIFWYRCYCDSLHIDVRESSSFLHIAAIKMGKGY